MYNHILLNVPENKIKMRVYRTGKKNKHKCGSTGCVLGHCTILDDWKNVPKTPKGEIKFGLWSEEFTSLIVYSSKWNWCFGAKWPDDKNQILLRLKYFIDNQKPPDDWDNNFDYPYVLPIEKLEQYEI